MFPTWTNSLLLFMSLGSHPVLADSGVLIVGVDRPERIGELVDLARELGAQKLKTFRGARLCILEFPGANEPPVDQVRRLPGVRYVERDRPMDIVPTWGPSQPGEGVPPPYMDPDGTDDCPDLWEMSFIGMGDAWTTAQGQGEAAPVVAIQDGGFLTSHEELVGRISGGYDYGNRDDDPEVEWDVGVPAHGTFIAGVIAAIQDNDAGRVGVIPTGMLNLQKIADSAGSFYYSYAVSAMADIAEGDLGVRVLSYSIASSSYTQSFKDAVEALEDADILLVAAAGNCSSDWCADGDNDDNPLYPASFSFDHVVTVAGVTQDGSFNSWSHYGRSSVDLAAPGVDICSLGVYSDDDYYTASGTSFATPIVAGVASLLLQAWPRLSTTELARVLRASCIETAELEELVASGGYLSATNALRTAVPRLQEPVDLVVDGRGTLILELTNAAHAGDGFILFTFDPSLSVVSAGDWEVEPFADGDTIHLPDAGDHVAGTAGVLLRGELPADSTFTLPVLFSGRDVGRVAVTVRLVAASEGADYLNSPYDQGSFDETGFLAWTFYADVRAVDTGGWPDSAEPMDTGATPYEDSGVPQGSDSASPCQEDSSRSGNSQEQNCPEGGCACGTTRRSPGRYGLWFLAFLLAGARRVGSRWRGNSGRTA